MIISVLLLQDVVAIVLLLAVEAMGLESLSTLQTLEIIFGPLVLAAVSYGAARHVLLPLMQRFDTIQEYLFLAAKGELDPSKITFDDSWSISIVISCSMSSTDFSHMKMEFSVSHRRQIERPEF